MYHSRPTVWQAQSDTYAHFVRCHDTAGRPRDDPNPMAPCRPPAAQARNYIDRQSLLDSTASAKAKPGSALKLNGILSKRIVESRNCVKCSDKQRHGEEMSFSRSRRRSQRIFVRMGIVVLLVEPLWILGNFAKLHQLVGAADASSIRHLELGRVQSVRTFHAWSAVSKCRHHEARAALMLSSLSTASNLSGPSIRRRLSCSRRR